MRAIKKDDRQTVVECVYYTIKCAKNQQKTPRWGAFL